MATVFWGHQGVLLVNFLFLTLGTTLNGASYYGMLGQLQETIHHNRSGLLTTGVLLLQAILMWSWSYNLDADFDGLVY